MSKTGSDKPTEEEERSSDEEGEKYQLSHSSSSPSLHEYSYHEALEPGPSHGVHTTLSGLEMQQPSGLRTRGPGRPRIHPLKPAGVSRPRGRPKGSRNKKPRKRLEKPPKRPRGRPRKWPPEMWEGFQRARQTVVHHHMKQRQPMHHQQDIPGPSHMYMEPSEAAMSGMQPMASRMHPMQTPLHHPPPHHQPLPHYMQLSVEPEGSQDLPLGLSHQGSVDLTQAHQQLMMPSGHSLMLPESEDQGQQQLTDPEELLWMQQLHPDQPHPTTTSR